MDYFSYCIKYRDDKEQRTDTVLYTFKYDKTTNKIENEQGLKAKVTKAFTKYRHLFHSIDNITKEQFFKGLKK